MSSILDIDYDTPPVQDLAGYDQSVPCADGVVTDGPRQPCYGSTPMEQFYQLASGTFASGIVPTTAAGSSTSIVRIGGDGTPLVIVEDDLDETTTVVVEEDDGTSVVSPVPLQSSGAAILAALVMLLLLKKAPTPWLPPRRLRGRTKPRAGY